MHTLVRKTLEIYIKEKRLITQSDFPPEVISMMWKKESVFVTLYYDGRVIASSWRIQCQKENTVFECIDNTLLCLKDPRFTLALQSPEGLEKIHIRVDLFASEDRRMLQNISELSVRNEWLIFLSQNLWLMSVVLPHMIHLDPTPERYFDLICKKMWLEPTKLTSSDYILYALKTREFTDMV